MALAALCTAASAHDTWFAPLTAGAAPDGPLLTLATGNRFPVGDLAVDDKFFVQRGCRSGDGGAVPLATLRYADDATVLRAGAGALTCFVQLAPFEFDVPLDKVEVYFKEIKPTAAVVAKWADMHARGLPFHERYTKSARIDLGAVSSPQPTGTAMDVLRTAPQGTIAVGTEVTFQLLRDGKPLADQPLELINERSPIGLWHRTDADGRIRAKLPLPGRWLLRGTDLRISASNPDQFESQFITYAFDVAR
jgi:Domain of unknown function (DUF4198)